MCRRAQWPRIVLAAALLVGLASPAFAQQAELDELAAGLAVKLNRLSPSTAAKLKIAVLPFREMKDSDAAAFKPDYRTKPRSKVTLYIPGEADERISRLGLLLANEFTSALSRHGQDHEIVDPAEMERIRRDELWTEKEMRQENLAACIARLAGARAVVTGRYEKSHSSLVLYVRAEYAEEGEKIDPLTKRIPFPVQWRELYSLALPAPKDTLEPPVRSFPDAPLPDGVLKPGKDGVSFPECEYCPDPSFTDEARAAKYMAKVLLRLTVLVNGKATDIQVIKPARMGLTQSAIDIVKTWRFKPSQNRDGKPVPVRVGIEITFRLF